MYIFFIIFLIFLLLIYLLSSSEYCLGLQKYQQTNYYVMQQDEIQKLIKRRDGQPLVKLPTPTNIAKKSARAEKAKLERGMQPHLKIVSFSYVYILPFFVCDTCVRDRPASNRRIAKLLRISRQKIAQQKNIGEYKSPGRKGRKRKGKGKKKSFPKQWVMKFADKVRVRVTV